ncbi:MAG: helix-turn-helix domain-containing protein [Lachnospiraceae bacterium]|nr:helix-turn-helix domain-containing protein [Lachnospiraceae bacterium]
MIKYLNGTRETVDFDERANLLLYDNTDFEEYPLHWHKPIEIIMPLQNGYRMECNGSHFDLKESDIIFIAPAVLHHLYAETGERLIFQADTSLFSNVKDFEYYMSLIHPALLITPGEYPGLHEELKKLMLGIQSEYFASAPLREAAIYSMLLRMFILISRENSFTNKNPADPAGNKQQEYLEKFTSICDYINTHCTEEISLEETADLAGFSKFHFSRLFKDFTGVTFYKYVNLRRINVAENLLWDPDINITEVAIRSGFNSVSAFMRMFKQIKGCTPTEFKKMKG